MRDLWLLYNESAIVLFDDNSFEISIQRNHGVDIKKGSYIKKGDKIILTEYQKSTFIKGDFSRVYIIKENRLLVLDKKCN